MDIFLNSFTIMLAVLLIAYGIINLIRMNKKTGNFLRDEADRAILKNNEVTDSWTSRGLIYTKGAALRKEKNGYKLIKQAKLTDISILID